MTLFHLAGVLLLGCFHHCPSITVFTAAVPIYRLLKLLQRMHCRELLLPAACCALALGLWEEVGAVELAAGWGRAGPGVPWGRLVEAFSLEVSAETAMTPHLTRGPVVKPILPAMKQSMRVPSVTLMAHALPFIKSKERFRRASWPPSLILPCE